MQNWIPNVYRLVGTGTLHPRCRLFRKKMYPDQLKLMQRLEQSVLNIIKNKD